MSKPREKKWRKVATHKRDVVVLQVADALRQVPWHERVLAVRAAALLMDDPHLHDKLAR